MRMRMIENKDALHVAVLRLGLLLGPVELPPEVLSDEVLVRIGAH